MNEFWRVFRTWFVSLMAIFIALNLLGFVSGFGRAKLVTAGFPWSIAEWIRIGKHVESHYFPFAIVPNAIFAVVVSFSIAAVCASSHRKPSISSNGMDAPSDEKQKPESSENCQNATSHK
jgi:hypothetical protein